jgi:uncharacterized membrane protein
MMPLIPFANNFLAGSLITLLIPVCVFIAIAVWYTYAVLRGAATRHEGTPEVPGPPQAPSPGLTAEGESPGAS